MKNLLNEQALLNLIKLKRRIMYKKANYLGFTDPRVVSCSQELDALLNAYQQKVS